MEFGMKKCTLLIMRYVKRRITEGLEITNQEKSEGSEKRKLRKTREHWKRISSNRKKIIKEYLMRTRNLLKPKQYFRNPIKEINNWVVPFVRFSGTFQKRTRENSHKWTREQEN